MSVECILQLEADTVEVGGEVRGRVRFLAHAPELEKARGLQVRAFVQVHGSGNTEELELGREALAGPLSGDSVLTFAFPVPEDGPVSFQGRHVKMDWRVEAVVELPWAKDPRFERAFRVVPLGAPAHGRSRAY